MIFFNVFTKKVFTDNDGKEQVKWFKAGYIKMNPNAGKFLILFNEPNTQYYLFESSVKKEEDFHETTG